VKTFEQAVGNASIMFVSQAITWTTTLGLTAILGRYLGAAGFGNLYLAITFGLIFSVLVDFGLDQHLVRAIARDRSLAGSYVVHAAAIKTGLALIAYGLIFGVTYFLGYPPELRWVIGIYTLILFFNGVSTTMSAVFQAHERLLHPAISTVIEKVSGAVIAVALLGLGFGVAAPVSAFVAGAALGAAWKAYHLRRLVPIQFTLDAGRLRLLVRSALPFFLYWVLGTVYYRIDVVLLSKLADANVVGWYGAAYRLFDTLVFLPGIISFMILYPILARLAEQSRADLRLAIGNGLHIMILTGLPICTGLFVLAEPIIRFVYGKREFLNAVPALQFLAVALFLLYLNSILAVVLVSLNQERRMTLVAGLALIVNFSLNWLLIPRFQHVAAAAVTAGTELLIFCYLLRHIPKDLLSRESLVVLAKGVGAVAIMAIVLTGMAGHSLLLLLPAGGLSYVASALLLRLVSLDDVRLVRQAVRRGRGSEPAMARMP